jgi:proliferating cell nuclear antigen
MEILFEKSSTLQKIIEAIKDLCKETTINVSEDNGFTIQAMDSSHISLVSLKLKKTLKQLSCERDASIALNLENLAKVLRACDSDLPLQMTLKPSAVKLNIKSFSEERGINFDISLMDIEMECLHIPDTEYPIRIRMPVSDLTRLCRDVRDFGEVITISVKDDSVDFTVEGDLTSGFISIKPSKTTTIIFGMNLEQSFTLRFLAAFTKASPISEMVELQLGENAPLKVTYQIFEEDKLEFYLAPRLAE